MRLHVISDELVLEARVLAPEAPDVRHLVQHHGETLDADAERPASLALHARVVNQLLNWVNQFNLTVLLTFKLDKSVTNSGHLYRVTHLIGKNILLT